MKIMKKNLFLSFLLLCSMMFFASCSKDDDPGSNNNSDNNSDTIAEMKIATATNEYSSGSYIFRKGNQAYLRLCNNVDDTYFKKIYSYAYTGQVAGLKDMERFIYDMPALTKVISDIDLLLSENNGYIIECNNAYTCWYIYKINRDASGNVVNIFYYTKEFTPYVGWDD